MISEVTGAGPSPRTIDLDWQLLLMEAVRKIDETRGTKAEAGEASKHARARRKVLVIDDSIMLLNFVQEILEEANYQVVAAPTAEEGLRAAAADTPHLILLDYVLPDMKGDEVLGRLLQEPSTANVPVVYMSGFGADVPSDPKQHANVIGSLNKPFTSELLLQTVAAHMPGEIDGPEPAESVQAPEGSWPPVDHAEAAPEPEREVESFDAPAPAEEAAQTAPAGVVDDAWWTAAPMPAPWAESPVRGTCL